MNTFKEGDFEVKFYVGCGFSEVTVIAKQIQVDHTHIGGWLFGPSHRALAPRLIACIKAGKVFTGYTIEKDQHGKTYCNATAAGFFHKHLLEKELVERGF